MTQMLEAANKDFNVNYDQGGYKGKYICNEWINRKSQQSEMCFFLIKKEPNRNSRNKQTKNYNIQNKKFTGWA